MVPSRALLFAANYFGRGKDRSNDRLISGAATDIAGYRVNDVRARGVGVTIEQRLGGENHARRAEAALGGEAFHEGPLQGMQHTPGGKAFERHDRLSGAALGERQTREARLAIDDHGAGAARALVAAGLRAVETKLPAQHRQQSRPAVDEFLLLLSVENE